MLKRSWLWGLCALAGMTSAAQAADMPLFPQPEEAVPAPQFEFGTGWYLRGDAGASYGDQLRYSQGFVDSYASAVVNPFGQIPTSPSYVAQSEWNYTVGGGAGYKFNDWFRFDVTGDYLGDQKANTYTTIYNGAVTVDGRSKFMSADGLVNAYADLGTYYGLQPYVGAGVGVSAIRAKGLVETSAYGDIPSTGTSYNSGYRYNFAWAVMAGVAFQISPHMLVDVGYRYLDLGQYSVPLTGERHDLTEHQARVGLRYNID